MDEAEQSDFEIELGLQGVLELTEKVEGDLEVASEILLRECSGGFGEALLLGEGSGD